MKLLGSLQESFSKSSSQPSLTAFALKQKSVEEEDYLVWAQETYGLPMLKTDYFQLHSPDKEFWTRWKDLYTWTADCIPVAEWDGILFVGCLERPVNFNSEIPVCFTLCSYVQLEMWHNRYRTMAPSVSGIGVPKPPAAAGLVAKPAKVPNAADFVPRVELFSASKPESNSVRVGIPEKPPEFATLELKDELTPSPKVAGSDDDSDEVFTSEDPPTGFETANPNQAAPTSLTATAPIKLERTGTLELQKIGDTKTTKLSSTELSKTEILIGMVGSGLSRTERLIGLNETGLSKTVPMGSIPGAHAAPAISQNNPAKAAPLTTTPVVITPPGLFYLTKICDINKDLLAKIRVLCEPLKTHFEKFILFSVDEGELQARPILWSPEFGNGVPGFAISLKIPSLFYIVASTYKPFHGPVTPNDINEKFFDDWNQGQIPDHATLIPIMHKDRLIGIVMGIAPNSAYTTHVLRQTTKVAIEITQRVIDQEAKAAA